MEELIIKYLTDILTPEEADELHRRIATDANFRREFERTKGALALADLTLDYPAPEVVREPHNRRS